MVRKLDALIALAKEPRGPMRREFWRSPLRGPWLTAVLGSVLLVGITVLFATGLLSYDAYDPGLAGNDLTKHKGILGAYLFNWPSHPAWLYRLNQGLHVTLGLVLVPVLLAKLWSVIPKLFEMPPVRSIAHMLERMSLLLLVGGVIFEFVTGIMDIQAYYRFPGSFYTLHFYGAWVFMAAFVAHVSLRFGRMIRGIRSRKLREVLTTDVANTRQDAPAREDDEHGGLVTPAPSRPTMSRRGVLGLVGASSLSIFLLTVGQSVGGGLRKIAILAPRGRNPATGPNGFQINRTAAEVGIRETDTDESWRLTLHGVTTVVFTREDLQAMPQYTSHLPIACVEGWSTANQAWTGVRLRDLAAATGIAAPSSVYVESIQRGGTFGHASLARNQILSDDSLLALQVNGADISADHGYPARVIVPAIPGVHQTKWVGTMIFPPMTTLFRRLYGAHPLHLLVSLASFGLAGYAALQLFKLRTITVVIWFGGAAVAHDLLILPLYGIIDFGMMHFWHRKGADLPTAPWVNYVRVPALISGVLFLIYLPGILRLSGSYPRASTLSSAHFMGDWLLVTGIAFLVSAITFAVRLRLMSKRHASVH